MADLDSRGKRASSVQILVPSMVALVLPDGTINQGDRQHTVWSYSRGAGDDTGIINNVWRIIIPATIR